jgi:Zn-dependent M28 family amino/carboxypeptidase
MDKTKRSVLLLFSILLCLSLLLLLISSAGIKPIVFDGQRAYEDVKYQAGLGPRILGSEAHENTVNWIISRLQKLNWDIDIQEADISEVSIKNIIAKKGTGVPWIIIASHYDSRLFADQDPTPEGRKLPVIGANDGASSVAILLELARILPDKFNKQIWLVFFDAEDNGNIQGYEWRMGSQYFVDKLNGKPDAVVILDMVGDKNLNIYMERNSNPDLNKEIWGVASKLGYSPFIPTYKYSLIDDHIPFLDAGIRAADVIDFDYPYWHTTNDTLDKISADSLKAVGETIFKWLDQYSK